MKALKEKKAPKAHKVPTEVELREVAIRWMALKVRENALSDERKLLGGELIDKMKRGGVNRVMAGDRTVLLETSKKKNVSKTNVVEFFGEGQGEAFWKSVPDSVSQYLSLSDKVKG